MTKTTLKLRDTHRDAVARAREQAIETARKHVIAAKRRLCERARASAYVDGHFVQPIDGRTDRRN